MSGMNETPKGNRTHIAAIGYEVSRVWRSTVYNRTPVYNRIQMAVLAGVQKWKVWGEQKWNR